jgi:hypothetical protein
MAKDELHPRETDVAPDTPASFSGTEKDMYQFP